MGKPMVRNLMTAGYSLTVYDVVGSAMEEMVTEGATGAASAREAAESSAVTITMVPDSPQSEAAILGPDGVLEGTAKGNGIIDMSSIAPSTSQKIGAACDATGVAFLDAPVSGGEPKAIDGTLAIMVGGSQEVFDRYAACWTCWAAAWCSAAATARATRPSWQTRSSSPSMSRPSARRSSGEEGRTRPERRLRGDQGRTRRQHACSTPRAP
ncbi:2-hydroxy-3-oxopropionate reductase [Geodia barretti]|uniref:3-hydroxyisobutyrate dehydrogenase n=1 Tax=Geodia barretti TaxID=519541 RepID=A0AA35WPB2_GEOBA|nr:2-hydroxy-3-oxopropionate reductase [Geodia barretti]